MDEHVFKCDKKKYFFNKYICLKNLLSKYFPFIIMFLIFLFLHLFMTYYSDDKWYLKINDLFSYLPKRYSNWSSRLIIESTLISLLKVNINVWRILDSFMVVLALYMIIKLINKKQIKDITFLGCCLFLMYPFTDLRTAGWFTTTLHYMWTFALGMFSFLPLINYEEKKETKKVIYCLCIIAIIYATNQEQSCAIILGMNLLYLINKIVKKEKVNKYNIMCIAVCVFSFIFMFTCPGNKLRFAKEINNWLPTYTNLNFFHKIYLGVVPTVGVLLRNRVMILFFAFILMLGVFVYARKNISKILALSNLIIISLLTVFYDILISTFLELDKIGVYFHILKPVDLFYLSIIAFCICMFIAFSFLYSILVIFGKEKLLPFFCLLAGMTSCLIMGFSPTVFASLNRTQMFLYMSMIIVSLFVLYKLCEDKKISDNTMIVLKSVVSLLGLFNIINIFLILF